MCEHPQVPANKNTWDDPPSTTVTGALPSLDETIPRSPIEAWTIGTSAFRSAESPLGSIRVGIHLQGFLERMDDWLVVSHLKNIRQIVFIWKGWMRFGCFRK